MKILVIAAVAALGVIGLASAGQAHRQPQVPPPEEVPLECPSVKNWAKCLWQELDRNSSG